MLIKTLLRLLILPALIVLVVAVSWFYRTAILQSGLPLLLATPLKQAGIKNLQIKLNDIGERQTLISSLIFDIAIKTGKRLNQTYRVKLDDVQLGYNFEAVRNGRLDSITIKDTQLIAIKSKRSQAEYYPSTMPKTNSVIPITIDEITNLIQLYRSHWREKIPVKKVSIKTLLVQGSIFKGLSGHNFSIEFDKIRKDKKKSDSIRQRTGGGRSEKSAVWLQIQSPTLAEKITLNIDKNDRLVVNLDEDKTAAVRLELNDKAIHINYKLDIQRLQVLLNKLKLNHQTVKALPAGHTDKVSKNVRISPVSGNINLILSDLGIMPQTKEPAEKMQSQLMLKTDSVDTGHIHLQNFSTTLLFNFSRTPTKQTLLLSRGSFVSYKKLRIASTNISNSIRSNFTLSNLTIALHGQLVFNETRVTNAVQWIFNGHISTKSIHVHQLLVKKKSIDISLKNLLAAITITSKQIAFTGSFSPSSIPARLEFKGVHRLSNNSGRLSLKTKKALDLSADKTSLSQIISPWDYPFDLVSGKISLTTKMFWSATKPFHLSTIFSLDDVGGRYKDIVFSGLNTRQNLSILPAINSKNISRHKAVDKAGLIKLDHLDSGIVISDIRLKLALHTDNKEQLPVIKIDNLAGHLFDGEFSSHQIKLDFNQPDNHLQIDVRDIDLTKLSDTQQFSGLAIAGKLNGVLPIEINKEGIFVNHGHFYNAGRKGYIRYKPKADTGQIAANSLSNIALKALRDFEYNKLDAVLSYVPDGSLSINLQLNGISPELGKNQRVNLNINTQQNVLALLKSLRYAQGLDKRIDARVRRTFNKK